MKFNEFKDKIEAAYHGKFDKSHVACRIFKCCGKSVTIDCTLAGARNECINNIAANDMFSVSFIIHLPDRWNDDDDLPENMELICLAKSIQVKPSDPILYCDRRKISFRKAKGNGDKLASSFKKFVDRLYKAVIEEYTNGNLLDFDSELITAKGYR